MAEKVHDPVRPGGFAWAEDIPWANKACGKRPTRPPMNCEACKRRVILHCGECRIQITGCLCTLVERMGPVEAYKTLARQVGQIKARAEMLKFGHNMPYLPGLPD